MMGHSLEVFHGTYVKAHPDTLERDRACETLVELGLGVADELERSNQEADPAGGRELGGSLSSIYLRRSTRGGGER